MDAMQANLTAALADFRAGTVRRDAEMAKRDRQA